jgi:hypothetical protein
LLPFTWKDSDVRNPTASALALGILLSIISVGMTQDVTVQTPAKAPLEIVDECIRAVQQRDFASYVDHLSGDEQKMQAGYALFLSSTIVPAFEVDADQIEPEMLLLLRAVGDLVKEHTADGLDPSGVSPVRAANHSLFEQVFVPAMTDYGVGYAMPQSVRPPRVREVFMKSAEALKDPRSFLIAVLTEYSRPVQVAGAEPMNHSNLPALAELAKVYQRQEWTLYTRGNYAIAVPVKRESVLHSPSDGPQPISSEPEQAPWPLQIEFQKIDGAWKISHILPMSLLTTLTGATASRCTGPECDTATPSNYDPPVYAPYSSESAQSPPPGQLSSPR